MQCFIVSSLCVSIEASMSIVSAVPKASMSVPIGENK